MLVYFHLRGIRAEFCNPKLLPHVFPSASLLSLTLISLSLGLSLPLGFVTAGKQGAAAAAAVDHHATVAGHRVYPPVVFSSTYLSFPIFKT
jgi:hypothetical protein